MSRAPSQWRNVLANWSAYVVNIVISFFLAPYVVRQLGDSAYGIWMLLVSVVGYMGLLDFGIRGAVMRFVAGLHATGDHDEASRIAGVGISLFGIMGGIAILISVLIAPLVDHIFNIPPELIATTRWILLLGGLNVAIALLSGVYGGVVTALQRFDLASGLEIVVGAVRAGAVVLALGAGGGLIALAVIQLGTTVARGLLQLVLTRRLYPVLRLRPTWSQPHARRIFSFSAFSTILHISGIVIYSTDSLVIGSVLPVAAVTLFAIGANPTIYARALLSGLSQTVTPRTSALEATATREALRSLILQGGRIGSLIVLPMAITFVVRGATFIGLWMGPQYAEPSGRILAVLGVTLAFAGARQMAISALLGLSEHRQFALFGAVEALMNLGLSIYWIRPLGIDGVALATLVPSVLTSLLVTPWILLDRVGLRPATVLRDYYLLPLLAMIPFMGVTVVMERYWVPGHVFGFLGQVAVALPSAMLVGWYVAFSAPERARILAGARARLRRPTARADRGGSPEPAMGRPARVRPAADGGGVGVLAFVPERWGGPWLSRHHILTRLAEHFPVAWVDPQEEWRMMLRGRHAIWPLDFGDPVPRDPRFQVLRRRIWYPRLYRPDLITREIARRHAARGYHWLRRRGCSRVVMYLWRYEFAPVLELVPHALSLYHIVDEYSFSDVEQPTAPEELDLIRRVNRVIVHSPGLREKKGHINPATTTIPNGVDFEHYATPAAEPPDLARIPHPRIGYVGIIKHQLDLPLLHTLARAHPEWSVVLVGPVRELADDADWLTRLQTLPNVHLLGVKPAHELAGYMQHMDVNLLPYRLTGYTKFIYPIKLHEYLAAGVPVVASPIRSLLRYEDIVRLARTPAAWEAAVARSLRGGPEQDDRVLRGRQAAADHAWPALVERIAATILDDLGSLRRLP